MPLASLSSSQKMESEVDSHIRGLLAIIAIAEIIWFSQPDSNRFYPREDSDWIDSAMVAAMKLLSTR